MPKSKTEQSLAVIDPSTIDQFFMAEGWLQVVFKNGDTLKWKSRACTMAQSGNRLAIGAPQFAPELLLGGKVLADGKRRCQECGIVLGGSDIGQHCWEHGQQVDAVRTIIHAAKKLGVLDSVERTRACLLEQQVADLHKVNVEEMLKEMMRRYRTR